MTADPRARRWALWQGPGKPAAGPFTLEELVETVKAEAPNRAHDDRVQLDLFGPRRTP